jgi:hypothetical protein
LFGQLLHATGFKRWNGTLMLVVVLPDGSPGTLPLNATDLLGTPPPATRSTILSADGMRALRTLVMAIGSPKRSTSRPKKRK